MVAEGHGAIRGGTETAFNPFKWSVHLFLRYNQVVPDLMVLAKELDMLPGLYLRDSSRIVW